ncbi:S-adenosylmethionine-dependent methyltransferase domain protein [Leptospira ellinghausenii]|uniref:tRNA (guanine-N(7)-)-methyltransferase n=1 Tax=Leptospira ellinghausenii TaxID=1917822 RepID=A0A2P2DH80_9LEPT|nr:tRNA (guanosine(46)-N7)-methyltransferase TrmB [Leptospira ellinghausenii]GBF43984.1 S-adenosylmethionine-dependent methyltransferase domain protein [Leptospira ellinghausenii]
MLVNPEIQEKLWKFTIRTSYKSDYLLQPNERGKKIDLKNSFPSRTKNFVLELGSGWGEVAIELAKNDQETGYLLMEKKVNRIIHTEKQRKTLGLENIRYMTVNFQWFFDELLEKEIFDKIIINFPDPWPKKKHHKNRLMQPHMIQQISSLLKPGGELLFATDYGPYARKTISLLRKFPEFLWKDKEYEFERPGFPISFFEAEKRSEGKRIYYLKRTKPL